MRYVVTSKRDSYYGPPLRVITVTRVQLCFAVNLLSYLQLVIPNKVLRKFIGIVFLFLL